MWTSSNAPEAGRYGLWRVSVEAQPNTWANYGPTQRAAGLRLPGGRGMIVPKQGRKQPEAGKYGLWRVSVKAQPNTWIEQETGGMLFHNDCSSQQCVATLFSRRPHADGDAGAYLRTRRAHTAARDVGPVWKSRGWQIVDRQVARLQGATRVSGRLDDIRRNSAHRSPDEPTSDRHPSHRLRRAKSSAP